MLKESLDIILNLTCLRPIQHAWRWPSAQWQWGQWERTSKFCTPHNTRNPFQSNISKLLILTCFFVFFLLLPYCECLDSSEGSFCICTSKKVLCAGFSPIYTKDFAFFYQREKIPTLFSTFIASSWGRRWRITQLKESTCLISWKLQSTIERLSTP